MSSMHRIAASRLNGRKSRGPRSAAGKAIVSRNAVARGLAAMTHRQPVVAADVEPFARALCGDDDDPTLFQQAVVIAHNDLALRAIAAQQLAVVERVREPLAQALTKGNDMGKLAKARAQKCYDAYDQIVKLRDELLEKHKDQLAAPILSKEQEALMPQLDRGILIPPHLEEFLIEREDSAALPSLIEGGTKFQDEARERDESATLEEAVSDLIRLDRYERRAWSRQKKAMRAFMNLKLTKRLVRQSQSDPGWQTIAAAAD